MKVYGSLEDGFEFVDEPVDRLMVNPNALIPVEAPVNAGELVIAEVIVPSPPSIPEILPEVLPEMEPFEPVLAIAAQTTPVLAKKTAETLRLIGKRDLIIPGSIVAMGLIIVGFFPKSQPKTTAFEAERAKPIGFLKALQAPEVPSIEFQPAVLPESEVIDLSGINDFPIQPMHAGSQQFEDPADFDAAVRAELQRRKIAQRKENVSLKKGIDGERAPLRVEEPIPDYEAPQYAVKERLWTDAKGRMLVAPVVRSEYKNVVFSIDGAEVKYPLNLMSKNDVDLLRDVRYDRLRQLEGRSKAVTQAYRDSGYPIYRQSKVRYSKSNRQANAGTSLSEVGAADSSSSASEDNP